MKRLIGMIGLVASTMLMLLTGVATFVVGYRIIVYLFKGLVNIPLCLEFLGIAVLLGICIATMTTCGEMCDIDMKVTSNEIVGKHEGDDDRDE
jgi:hypothetical protein